MSYDLSVTSRNHPQFADGRVYRGVATHYLKVIRVISVIKVVNLLLLVVIRVSRLTNVMYILLG